MDTDEIPDVSAIPKGEKLLLWGACPRCGKQIKGYRSRHSGADRLGRHNCDPLPGWTPIEHPYRLINPRPRASGKLRNRAYEVPLKAFRDDELQLMFELVEAEMVRRAER